MPLAGVPMRTVSANACARSAEPSLSVPRRGVAAQVFCAVRSPEAVRTRTIRRGSRPIRVEGNAHGRVRSASDVFKSARDDVGSTQDVVGTARDDVRGTHSGVGTATDAGSDAFAMVSKSLTGCGLFVRENRSVILRRLARSMGSLA